MNRVVFILLFFTFFSYSQEKMSYYFDRITITNNIDYNSKESYKAALFKNSKDSTYVLVSILYSNLTRINLNDYKNKYLINFDVEGRFENEKDANKIKSASIIKDFTFSYHYQKKGKKEVEYYRFERDTTSGNVILHYIRYKNKKLKKINFESFYFFETKEEISSIDKDRVINYFKKNFNLPFKEDEKLVKQIFVKKNKIIRQVEFLSKKQINFNLEFKADEIYPVKILSR